LHWRPGSFTSLEVVSIRVLDGNADTFAAPGVRVGP
jgi:hypothetical protein